MKNKPMIAYLKNADLLQLCEIVEHIHLENVRRYELDSAQEIVRRIRTLVEKGA
jgi:hypothetical protein